MEDFEAYEIVGTLIVDNQGTPVAPNEGAYLLKVLSRDGAYYGKLEHREGDKWVTGPMSFDPTTARPPRLKAKTLEEGLEEVKAWLPK